MISGYGPADVPAVLVTYDTGTRCPPSGGRGEGVLPAGGSEGGRAAVSPFSSACIVISGQMVSTPVMVGTGPECVPDFIARVARCPSCGKTVQMVPAGCGLITCPRCSRRWARRGGERGAARAWGAFLAGSSKHKPRHITFELDWVPGDSLVWDSVKARAVEIGCTGGLLVVHPWRILPDAERAWERERDQGKTDMNRYTWVKKNYGMGGFVWSPHAHGIVYGRFENVTKGSDLYRYRNIRRVNSLRACEGIVTYLLSHTAVPPGRAKAYRYFGICSPQKLKPEWAGNLSVPMCCENCGHQMVYDDSVPGIPLLVLTKHFFSDGWRKIEKGPPS